MLKFLGNKSKLYILLFFLLKVLSKVYLKTNEIQHFTETYDSDELSDSYEGFCLYK